MSKKPNGTKNLITMAMRSEAEQKALQIAGGKASGVARKRKGELKKLMQALLECQVTNTKTKEKLKEMGLETTNQTLMLLALFQKAVSTDNVAAIKEIRNIIEDDDAAKSRELKSDGGKDVSPNNLFEMIEKSTKGDEPK